MISFETVSVSGLDGAIAGMRNPFKNREKSDSGWAYDEENTFRYIIGPKDLDLCQKLLRAGGDDDSKFMRYIHVQVDINAPLYWWKEFDTYKVSTVANSESTMHTIHKREFTYKDFANDRLLDDYTIDADWQLEDTYPQLLLEDTVSMLNELRRLYLKAVEEKRTLSAKDYWYNMIQLLPSSYMQKRTVDLNYQTLRRMYFARRHHKLAEWSEGFIDWLVSLPYAEELIGYEPESPKKVNVTHESYKKAMGKLSNLISTMVAFGADLDDTLKVFRYSSELIDSEKNNIDPAYLQLKYDIPALESKYLDARKKAANAE